MNKPTNVDHEELAARYFEAESKIGRTIWELQEDGFQNYLIMDVLQTVYGSLLRQQDTEIKRDDFKIIDQLMSTLQTAQIRAERGVRGVEKD